MQSFIIYFNLLLPLYFSFRLVGLGSSWAIYRWRNTLANFLYDLSLQLSLSTSDYSHWQTLKRIEIAYHNNLSFYNQIKDQKKDLKKNLGSLSSDIDYIFKKLDSVSGGDFVKALKKELSTKVVQMSNNIDAQLRLVLEEI